MSKQTEAMNLALEQTLEMLIDNREYIEANERSEYLAMYDKAIAGAEKALVEQPAQQEQKAQQTFAERCQLAQQLLPDAPYRTMLTQLHAEMLARLAEQPAQQEPYGYVWFNKHMEHRFTKMKPHPDFGAMDITPIYTTPQAQPARKPLTDEQIRDLWSWSMTAGAERTANTQQHAFARAIEAKLKEKNHD